MKPRIGFGLTALCLSVVTVFAFQNCGQGGSITSASTSSEKAAANTDPVSDPTSPPSNPPPSTPPPTTNRPPTSNHDHDDEDDGHCEFEHHNRACQNIAVSDVNLAIDYIALPGGMIVLSSDSKNFVISNTQKSIKVKALVDANLSEIRLVLKDSGNSISGDGEKYDLKTPSAQQSGIKVKLEKPVSVKKDMMYELVVEIDLNDQIVAAGNKCIFKPVIKSAKLL